MDAELTTVDPQQLANTFEETLRNLVECGTELQGLPLGPMKANLAMEYAREAQRYLKAVEESELREQARRLDQAHKYSTKILNRVRKPAELLLKLCTNIRSDWELERRRRIEQERRQREEEANRIAEEQRKAEVAHLKQIGKTNEAEARAAAPVVPITVSVDPDKGKVEGEQQVEVWAPRRDESGAIVFSDEAAYLAWLAATPDKYYLVQHRYGKIKKLLTDNRGMLQPPGLEIEHRFESRTRNEAEDG